MEASEKVKLIYTKYKKMNLNTKEMSQEIGISSAKVYEMFSQLGERLIIEKKLLPKWRKVGGTRMWEIEEIIIWNNQYQS
ncbi:MAG: hypothetical protein P8Y16_08330 [Sulfurimonas sp.]